MIKNHLLTIVIAAAAGAAAGAGMQRATSTTGKAPAVIEKVVRLAASRHAWPDLTQDETIAIGEKLPTILAGARISILCNDSACDDLAHDLDDAMQIADVTSTLERAAMSLDRGFAIYAVAADGRADALAELIRTATGGKLQPQRRSMPDIAAGSIVIAIGPRGR